MEISEEDALNLTAETLLKLLQEGTTSIKLTTDDDLEMLVQLSWIKTDKTL